MHDFSGKVAVVTGASRGLGYAIAQGLASAGAHVVLVARTQGALESLYDKITEAGGAATGCPLDLTDFAAIDRLGAMIAERWGRLDMLVGNAGVLGGLSPISHIKPADFENALAVNVTANARLIRALEPLLMQAEAPRALFITSGAANKARPFWGLYATSKAALNAMVQTWAHEHANDKLRVNLLSPGPVRTAMRAQAMPGEDPTNLPEATAITPLALALLAPTTTKTAEIVRYESGA